MQWGAAHTLVHAVLRHCHGVAFTVHSHRCELSTVARASVRNKQKHTSIRIEYKMQNNNQLLWCWNRNIPWESDQYHSCWWPGPPASSRHQQLCYWLRRINVTDKNTHMINLDKLKWKLNVLHLMNVQSCHGLSPVWCRATRWSDVNLFLVKLTLNEGWGEYAKPEYQYEYFSLSTSTSTSYPKY